MSKYVKYFFSPNNDKRALQFSYLFHHPDVLVELFHDKYNLQSELILFISEIGAYHSQIFCKLNSEYIGTPLTHITHIHPSYNLMNILKQLSKLPYEVQTFFCRYIDVVNTKTHERYELYEYDLTHPTDDCMLCLKTFTIKPLENSVTIFEMDLPDIPINTPQLNNIIKSDLSPKTLRLLYHHSKTGKIQPIKSSTTKFNIDMKKLAYSLNSQIPTVSEKKCFTTQFKGTDKECQRFIYNLIVNEDVEKLIEFFDTHGDSGFADIAYDEINNIDPKIAQLILSRFGFTLHDDNKYETFNEWIGRLRETSTSSYETINDEKNLKTYLAMLVNFVNSNQEPPDVNKPGYKCKTTSKATPVLSMNGTDINLSFSISKMIHCINTKRILASQAPSLQYSPIQSNSLVGNIIRQLVDHLTKNGKKMNDADLAKINKHLQMFENLRNAINELIVYNDMHELTENPKKRLSKYQLYIDEYGKLEMGLLKVAQKLSEYCDKLDIPLLLK